MNQNIIAHRETWLHRIRTKLAPIFEAVDAPIPENVRISCGFPTTNPLGVNKYSNGECWKASCSKGNVFEIFISPRVSDGLEVAAILVHELIHAAVGLDQKHGGRFKKVARELGLVGKMTATQAGNMLKAELLAFAEEIGPYPHDEMVVFEMRSGPKKQTTRLIKAECHTCGYTVRVTKRWLEVGPPHCPEHGAMSFDIGEEE